MPGMILEIKDEDIVCILEKESSDVLCSTQGPAVSSDHSGIKS